MFLLGEVSHLVCYHGQSSHHTYILKFIKPFSYCGSFRYWLFVTMSKCHDFVLRALLFYNSFGIFSRIVLIVYNYAHDYFYGFGMCCQITLQNVWVYVFLIFSYRKKKKMNERKRPLDFLDIKLEETLEISRLEQF